MKICTKRGAEKDDSCFPLNGSGKLRPQCKTCKNKYDLRYGRTHVAESKAYNAAYRKKNLAAIKAAKKEYYEENRAAIIQRGKEYTKRNFDKIRHAERKKKYGLTSEQFQNMFAEQCGRCAICLTPLARPHVDHNHATGRVRGLLCAKCNCGIGQLQDSPDLLLAAALYLERHV